MEINRAGLLMIEINNHSARDANATSALRRVNREGLLGLLARRGRMTRGQLADETGLTMASISRITREMIDAGVLMEGDAVTDRTGAGRRESSLSINPDGAYVLAVSLTANRRSVGLANALGKTIAIDPCEDLRIDDPEAALRSIASRAKSLVYHAGFRRGRLLGVGVSAAVSERSAEDMVTSDPLGWRDVPVRPRLAQELGLQVKVEHRASAILRAELTKKPDVSSLYLVNVALGIGVSAYLDGRIMRSGSAGFGSLSHFALPGNTAPCRCGRLGCLDACASGKAILSGLGQPASPFPVQAKRLVDAVAAADAGDKSAQQVFRDAGQRLGQGLDAVLALFNPEQIVLAGEVGRQRDFFEGALQALAEAGRQDAAECLLTSEITSMEAAVSVALQEFVLTGSLDLERLKAA